MSRNPVITIFQQQLNQFALLLHELPMESVQHRELERAYSQLAHYGQQLLDYTDKLSAVLTTAALLTTTLDVDTVLKRVLDTVIDIAGAERAYIMLREGSDDNLVMVAARKWDRASLDEADALYSESIVAHVLQHNKPVIALNAQEDPRFGHISSVNAKALRSLLCVPLVQRDEIIGVLYADNRVTKGVFHESLIPLMSAFAHHVVMVLENARRFQEASTDLHRSRQQVRWLQIQSANQKLVEPLSDRELEVLQLISTGRSNQEIAAVLTVEVSTVKKHINSIYGKLAADNRGKAIVRAQELKLV